MFKKRKKIKAPLRLRRFLRKYIKKNKRKSFVFALSYPKIISVVMMAVAGVLIVFLPTKAEGLMEIITNVFKVLNLITFLYLSVIKASIRIKRSNKFYERMITASSKV